VYNNSNVGIHHKLQQVVEDYEEEAVVEITNESIQTTMPLFEQLINRRDQASMEKAWMWVIRLLNCPMIRQSLQQLIRTMQSI
tara:strand:+ start:157 stop:405 length:249 start_codon:yes stop_codon:yes gene_type:complete